MSPKVSIILAVYNGEEYLAQAIQSVLSQGYTNFEFIIINDGSTDSTESIIHSFSDRRIICFNTIHLGFAHALNYGIRNSTGDYIARIDADDCWLPSKLEIQMEYFRMNPVVKFLATASILVNRNNEPIHYSADHTGMDHKQLLEQLSNYNSICHSSVIFRRDCINTKECYNPHYHNSLDYELWVRILQKNRGCLLEQSLVTYRVHAQMLTLTHARQQIWERLKIKAGLFLKYGITFRNIKFLLHDVRCLAFPKYYVGFYKILDESKLRSDLAW